MRDGRREFGSQSAQRQHYIKGAAMFLSAGRLSDGMAPHGSRMNHVYNSPHFKPHSSFNFWNDLHLNQSTRNKWENQSATTIELPKENLRSSLSVADMINTKLKDG
jgi:hypothetical protein